MNELRFKQQIVAFLKELGFVAYRIENRLEPGMPDLVIDRKGAQAIWLEAKCEEEPLNRNQEIWISRGLAAGGIIALARLRGRKVELSRFAPGPRRKPLKIPCGLSPTGDSIPWPPDNLSGGKVEYIKGFLSAIR